MKENRDSGVSKHEKLFKLLSKLKRDSLLPVIVFVFSKKQIEELATRMKGDFTSNFLLIPAAMLVLSMSLFLIALKRSL